MDQDTLTRLALQAGAARFYPERQATKDDAYLVGQGFLEKFAELVVFHHVRGGSLKEESAP